MVAGKIDAAEIVKGIKAGGGSYNMKTVEGGTLTAKMDGDKVAIVDEKGGGAIVEIADVYQSNGVAHVIDTRPDAQVSVSFGEAWTNRGPSREGRTSAFPKRTAGGSTRTRERNVSCPKTIGTGHPRSRPACSA